MAATENKVAKKAEAPKKARRFRPVKFFRDVQGELKKVTWPTKKELISHTGAVLAFLVGMAVLIGVLDLIFSVGIGTLGV